MPDALIERIYEAAFVPECWPDVLEKVAALSGSASGALLVFNPPAPPRFRATRVTHDILTAFTTSDAWKTNPREELGKRLTRPAFYNVTEPLEKEPVAVDPVADSLASVGLGHQAGTFIPLTHGEHAVITQERWAGDGRFEPKHFEILDGLRPHLARAALTAARLGLERARTTVATLEALGLAAAVLTGTGRVLAVNALLENNPTFLPGAHGRLIVTHPAADRLFRAILETAGIAAAARSVPVPAFEARPSGIVHVLPLCGAAHDILGGATLVVHAPMRMDLNVLDPSLLPWLFDLTPKEAEIAAALAAGRSLKEAAEDGGVRNSTARSYLEQVFRKTGTNQQSQLVALLKGTMPLPPS